MNIPDEWERTWPDIRRAWLAGTLPPHIKVDPLLVAGDGSWWSWDPVAERWAYRAPLPGPTED